MAGHYLILYEYYENIDIAVVMYTFHQTQDYAKIFQT